MDSTLEQLQRVIDEACQKVPAKVTVLNPTAKKHIGDTEVNWNFLPTSTPNRMHWTNVVPLQHPRWNEIAKLFVKVKREHGQAIFAADQQRYHDGVSHYWHW